MSCPSLDVSVVFLVFNRPETTAKVFDRIRAARPARLFIVADGPREKRAGDAEKCRQVRELIERGIDWPCVVVRDYSATNLGNGRRVASGITNAFKQVEAAIILEDDCLPDPTFFPFCAELLERYRDEARVGLIGGSHHQLESVPGDTSYYFCRYGNIWGWATWRRAWEKFDLEMNDWAQWRDAGNLERLFPDKAVQRFWRGTWNDVASGRGDTWDYQWTFCYMRHGMAGVLPRRALVENIGMGPDATHTAGMRDMCAPVSPMEFPLIHPDLIEPDREAEAKASRRFFSGSPLIKRLFAKLGRMRARLFAAS